MTRRILVDLDATVVDIHTPLLATYNREHDDDLALDRVTSWDITAHAKSPAIVDIWARPGFFRDLPALAGAIDAVRELHLHNEVFIVTAAEHPCNFSDKVEWLHERMPFISKRQIVFAHEKHLLDADVIIDDKPATATAYREGHPDSIILGIEYPYNRGCPAYNRLAESWRDTAKAWSLMVDFLSRKEVPWTR